ncbi:MAG: BlaI/MecI/CopY family transcriptional regulator [Cyclobacteriaceae bacterium]
MKKKKTGPTSSELEILQVLWKNSPLSVRAVHDQISENKETGYTTTLKTMQIMTEKGLVSREILGKKHVYSPVQTEDLIQDELLDKFLKRAFQGSTYKLVLKALGNHTTNRQELAEIQEFINQKKKENGSI